MSQRVEISRVVAEATRGVVIGGLLTPLGLIQAMAGHTRPLDVRAGLAMIKLRLLRALQGLGVRLHEIQPARLIYPIDGPVSGYCHHHPDPVVPVWWLTDEIAPSIEQAISMYDSRYTAGSLSRSLPTPGSPTTEPESTTNDTKAPEDSKPAPPLPSTGVVDAPRRIP